MNALGDADSGRMDAFIGQAESGRAASTLRKELKV